MNRKQFIKEITIQSEKAADEILLNETIAAMKEKLDAKRSDGRYGWWNDRVCDNQDLFEMAVEHLDCSKDDPEQLIDVINLLAMVRMNLIMEGELEPAYEPH